MSEALGPKLNEAAWHGHTATVRTLLKQMSAEAHAGDTNGIRRKSDFALPFAAYGGHTDTMRVLLQHKADVHISSGEDNRQDYILQIAAQRLDTKMICLLLEHGANVGHWTNKIIRRHLAAPKADCIGFGLRLGVRILSALAKRKNSVLDWMTVRNRYANVLVIAFDSTCQDLAVLVLSYV